jgi:hypothetical protein
MEVLQRPFELVPAATDVTLWCLDGNVSVISDLGAGFVHDLPGHQDFARHDRALCFLPAFAQTAGDEELIKAKLHYGLERCGLRKAECRLGSRPAIPIPHFSECPKICTRRSKIC